MNCFEILIMAIADCDGRTCLFSAGPTDISTDRVGVKVSHISSKKQQKESRKVDIHLKAKTLPTDSPHDRPHSLADLKMYKDTKILVAKFLEHSSCSLPPEVQQVVNNIKCVIKSDEKHMEEAIFSANVIDQVTKGLHAGRVAAFIIFMV